MNGESYFSILFVASLSCNSFASEPKVDERPALPFINSMSVSSQCGLVNEQEDVELYSGNLGVSKEYVIAHESSTVQLQWQRIEQIGAKLPDHRPGNVAGKRWCSGTLIAHDLVLTAAHCFETQTGQYGWITPFKPATRSAVYANPYGLATLMQINFKYQKNGETEEIRIPHVFPVAELVEYGKDRPGNLDYAIIRIGNDHASKLPGDYYSHASVLTTPVNIDQTIAIIQHPLGKPKKIDAGNVTYQNNRNVYYGNLDTHSASSGSGVRDINGNVVAVHTHGGCKVNSGANRAEPNSAIKNVSDIL